MNTTQINNDEFLILCFDCINSVVYRTSSDECQYVRNLYSSRECTKEMFKALDARF